MAELKTQPTDASVADFLAGIADEERRADAFVLFELISSLTKGEPRVWSDGAIGFGQYHYKYATGREGDWYPLGFALRKANLTLYILMGFEPFAEQMKTLGKYKTGKSCLYFRRLDDLHLPTLRKLIAAAVDRMAKMKTG